MRTFCQITLLCIPFCILVNSLHAEEKGLDGQFSLEAHADRAKKLAYQQDDLSADIQDLIDEQTDSKVIALLRETEIIMADATDLLEDKQTGGATIAIQTEIIEKIFESAQQKQQSSEGGEGGEESQENMGSMLQMMQNMMDGGTDKGAEQGEEKEGTGSGGGGGGNGGGNGSGEATAPDSTAENAERRVPKNAGNTNSTIPKEFQKAMDAYNKGLQQQ